MASLKFSLLLIFTLSLLTTPLPSLSFPFSQYQTLFSLAHSLALRVSNLRAARGDVAGAARARFIAHKIRPGLGLSFWRYMWSLGWDYLRNYSRDGVSFYAVSGTVSDLNELMRVVNELMRVVNELTRLNSGAERAAWVQRNYSRVLGISKSLFGRLSKLFYQPGPLREVVLMLQREVVDGELLRDCLELATDDLKGLIQIVKDIALQFSSMPNKNEL